MFFYVKNIYNALKINKILRGPVWKCRDAMHRVSTSKLACPRLKQVICRLKSLRGSRQSDFFVRKRIA